MRAGALRHRVTFDIPLQSQDAAGGEILTWTDESNGSLVAWASIEPLRGREALIAEQILGQLDTRIRIRWSPALDVITNKWRARRKGIKYDISTVAHVQFAQRMIEIICKSGLTDG